jgi:chemotaxis protein histidine kinase CheA
MSEDPMVAEFFEEVNDKFYPQIMEGIELMDGGKVKEGIEVLARPLHTIKGVTGFMPGFEEGSSFTHRVESFLKKLTAGELEHSGENVSSASRAVQMVFQVLERIRESGDPGEEAAEVLALLESLSAGGAESSGGGQGLELRMEEKNGSAVIRLGEGRLHLRDQREQLVEILDRVQSGKRVLLEMSGLKSINSTSFEAVEQFAEKFSIFVSGLNQQSKSVFFGWGFDEHISLLPCEEQFWERPEGEQ